MPTSLYSHARIYDQLFAGDDRDVRYWVSRLGPAPGPILDLATGTGRFAIPFARAGYQVAGLDLSDGMLAEASRKAAASAVSVTWALGDMRSFELTERFSRILVLGNSLTHLTRQADLHAMLRAVRRHLAPGGRFGIDVFVPDRDLLARTPQSLDHVGAFTDPDTGRQVELVSRTWYEMDAQVRHIRVLRRDNGDLRPFASMKLRMHFPEDLLTALAATGFRVVEHHGDYSATPFTAEARRQLLLCEVARAAS